MLILEPAYVRLESSLIGTLALLTKDGHCYFPINETLANQIIDLKGDSPPLIEELPG